MEKGESSIRHFSERMRRDKGSGVFSPEGLIIPALIVASWYLATRGGTTLLPSPEQVMRVLLSPGSDIASCGSLLWNIFVSLARVVAGLLAGILIGTPVGFLMGAHRLSRRLLFLITEMARPLSPLALLPFSIIVFRDTTLTKVLGLTELRYSRHLFNEIQLGMVFILLWGAVFPIILDTMHGVRGVRKRHLEVAKVSGAGRWFTFLHVMIPASLPDILSGYRMAVGRCWMVIIAAEMLPGTNSGIGYLLRYSYQISRYDVMAACVIVIALVGALFAKGLADMGEARLLLRAEER
jgi:NitT/TauT family transport system permease protein